MERRAKRLVRLALLVVGALLAVAVYWDARPVAMPRFAFLGGHEPKQREMQQGWRGRQDAVVYGFAAEHDSICRAARAELVPLGYVESESPMVDESGRRVPDAQDRLRAVVFTRATGRAWLQVHIVRGYSLPALPETPGFAGEVDWVHVEITRSQGRFTLRGRLRGWWKKLGGKRTPRPAPKPATP